MQSTSSRPNLQWSPDKHHSDPERWICIYPAYINSKNTLVQGRRLPKDRCIENPTHQEMRDVLSAAGLNVGVEAKFYSRERSREPVHRGRIRVQIKRDDGSCVNPDFPSRESVMVHLCNTIPKLKSRQRGGEQLPSQSASKGKGKGKGQR